MNEEHKLLLWQALASIAGAITSLSFQAWKGMSAKQVMLSIFVAASFAFFVAPLIFSNIQDTRAAGGIFYLMATGSNVLIPMAVRWLARSFGSDSKGGVPPEEGLQ